MKMSLKVTTFIKRCGLLRVVKCWKTSRLLDAYFWKFWQFWTTSKIGFKIELRYYLNCAYSRRSMVFLLSFNYILYILHITCEISSHSVDCGVYPSRLEINYRHTLQYITKQELFFISFLVLLIIPRLWFVDRDSHHYICHVKESW